MKHLLLNAAFLLFTIVIFSAAKAQDSAKHATPTIEEQINNKHFTFVAKWASPMTGQVRQLTDYYDFEITNDSVITYLPYFGRSYIAPADPSNVSLNLSLPIDSYTATERKKGGWNIVIKPKDQTDVQSFSLIIFDNGSASLNVTSSNRDPISYNGTLENR